MALFVGSVAPERHLCHCTTRSAALGSILLQAQFRLGPLTWTNDPDVASGAMAARWS
jgi:hypothetical protein